MEKTIPFYTPIWRFTTPINMDDHVQKCLEIKSNNGVHRSNKGGYQSEIFLKDNFKYRFDEIYSFVMDSVNAVGKDTESVYELSNFWVNINEKNNYNVIHSHPQSSISGCIYLKTNSNSGRIVFVNPSPSAHYIFNSNIHGFWEKYWFLPIVGELIMFPSYLSHYVEPNDSEDVRVSIAFNCHKV
jgi:uncharacterized protein (TIGR02466 family)